MMTQFKRRPTAALRLGAALPVVAGMMMLCSFTPREASADERSAAVSVLHVGPGGVTTADGRHLTYGEIADFVAAERAKLPAAERASMMLTLRSEADGQAWSENLSMPVVALCGDGEVRLDGAEVTLAELEERLRTRRGELTPEQWQRAEVRIVAAADGITMGRVDEVRQVLRRASWLRVRYMADETAADGVSRLLAPLPAASADGKVRVVRLDGADGGPVAPEGATTLIKERNLFAVRVNARGRILAGSYRDLEEVAVEELAARVGAFLRNAGGSDALPEREEREFELPDGRRAVWPVSRGIVSVEVRDCSYATYCAVQRALTAAFDGLRNEAAQVWFGRSVAALTEAERAVVLRAVPVKVFEREAGGDVPPRR